MSDVAEAVQKGLQYSSPPPPFPPATRSLDAGLLMVRVRCRVVANLPEEVHWLCDKVEPTATGRQPANVEDEATRADSTMHAIMLLSFSDQEANQLWLKRRIAQQLARCPTCVEEFYSLKRCFYQKLLPCVYHRSSRLPSC